MRSKFIGLFYPVSPEKARDSPWLRGIEDLILICLWEGERFLVWEGFGAWDLCPKAFPGARKRVCQEAGGVPISLSHTPRLRPGMGTVQINRRGFSFTAASLAACAPGTPCEQSSTVEDSCHDLKKRQQACFGTCLYARVSAFHLQEHAQKGPRVNQQNRDPNGQGEQGDSGPRFVRFGKQRSQQLVSKDANCPAAGV